MISQENRDELIRYRIEQAKETIDDANLLISNNKFRSAVNRIYYGMFYMLLAIALKYEFETSKHQQLIGWFNKNLIHAGIVDPKYGKMIKDAFRNRQKSDYETYVEFLPEAVNEMFESMKIFIDDLEILIMNK
jgi:uncharacterized protein (UPF0332 family)